MIVNRKTGRQAGPRPEMRAIERASGTEYHLTASSALSPAGVGPEALLSGLAKTLAGLGVEPIREMIYGSARARAKILALRRRIYSRAGLDPGLPATYITGDPVCGASLAGVQVWGVVPKSPERPAVTTVKGVGGRRGRLWSERDFRFLYLSPLDGMNSARGRPSDAVGQAKRMFLNAGAAMASLGFPYASTIRTWIYLRRILDWYPDFNRVRGEFYEGKRFFKPSPRAPFPASTGIQGKTGDEECLMGVLALLPAGPGRVEIGAILKSRRQGEAFSYGSGFSRGAYVRARKIETIHVSGTASIGVDGKSLYRGDPEKQSVQTLMSVAALLEERGAGLGDICSATVFVKDRRAWKAFLRAARRLGTPRFPMVPVVADICRPELLVEIEAIASIRRRGRYSAGVGRQLPLGCPSHS